jgi:alkylated DNA repair dioxygenase AlkB
MNHPAPLGWPPYAADERRTVLDLEVCAKRTRAQPGRGHGFITEYTEDAAIGWHKDRSVFGDVVGISLLSPCTFRFRKKAGAKWERRSLIAEPRSVYLLRGPSRSEWEHSIPGVDSPRYSITFRNVLERTA